MNRMHGANELTEVKEGAVRHEFRKSSGGIKLGDVIWIKLHPSSWWPAQVVDADSVSERVKPRDRSAGEVLVRIYGSYQYVYVDPLESRTEFEKVLKLYNGNYDQILKDSLYKDRGLSDKLEGLAISEATLPIGDTLGTTGDHSNPVSCMITD